MVTCLNQRQLRLVALVGGILAASPAPASAQPAFWLSWQRCATVSTDTAVYPGANLALATWALGLSAPHKGYKIVIDFAPSGGQVYPDAWRFDAAGCQSGMIVFSPGRPAADNSHCGDILSGAGQMQSRSAFVYEPDRGMAVMNLDVAYEPDVSPDPSIYYWLGICSIYHNFSVLGNATEPGLCGHLDTAMCLHVRRAEMVAGDGSSILLTSPAPYLTVEALATTPGDCAAVPANSATWGRIKVQYRN